MSVKLSALPTPRPPETTIAASVSSGRSPVLHTRPVILAALRRRDAAVIEDVSASGAPPGGATHWAGR